MLRLANFPTRIVLVSFSWFAIVFHCEVQTLNMDSELQYGCIFHHLYLAKLVGLQVERLTPPAPLVTRGEAKWPGMLQRERSLGLRRFMVRGHAWCSPASSVRRVPIAGVGPDSMAVANPKNNAVETVCHWLYAALMGRAFFMLSQLANLPPTWRTYWHFMAKSFTLMNKE